MRSLHALGRFGREVGLVDVAQYCCLTSSTCWDAAWAAQSGRPHELTSSSEIRHQLGQGETSRHAGRDAGGGDGPGGDGRIPIRLHRGQVAGKLGKVRGTGLLNAFAQPPERAMFPRPGADGCGVRALRRQRAKAVLAREFAPTRATVGPGAAPIQVPGHSPTNSRGFLVLFEIAIVKADLVSDGSDSPDQLWQCALKNDLEGGCLPQR